MADLSNLARLPLQPEREARTTLDYLRRVNRVIDHVQRHLAEPLRLDELAQVANFSPYHFHRIFTALAGETLAAFVKRLRLERALQAMSHDRRATLTQIALAAGFASSSDFSRAFRERYGVPPRAFDVQRWRLERRERMQDALVPEARHLLQRLPDSANPDGFSVTQRELPARRVAYLRVARPYEGDAVQRACEQLVAWARERGLEGGQWLGYQWEDPELVPLELCRYDVAVEIPEDASVGREVSEGRFSAMRVAEIAIDGAIDLEMRAIDYLYRNWLPASGFIPDHQPGFEAWKGLPFADGTGRFRLRLQIPVIPA